MRNTVGMYRHVVFIACICLVLVGCSSSKNNGGNRNQPPLPPPPSSDASLANLSLGNLVLVPAFDPAVMNYTASAVYRTDNVDVAATTNHAAATFQINGGSITSFSLPLGNTNITVDVTAEDGVAMRAYSVAVTREAFAQQAYIKASNSQAGDWFGDRSVSLSSNGNIMAIGASGESSVATGIDGDQTDNTLLDAGAVYVFTRDNARIWSQQAYVKASNAFRDDSFGGITAISADGNTLVVAAHREDSAATGINGNQADNSAAGAGAAYVFTRNGGGIWTQQAYVKASNTAAGDEFASNLSLSGDGNTLVASSPSSSCHKCCSGD